MNFKPFVLTLFDDGETLDEAHVHPELTMITTSINGAREPARIVDTEYFLLIADAIREAQK